MPPLNIEIYDEGQRNWHQVGQINPGDPYGSISDNTQRGRDVYYFGVDVPENKAVIKKSVAGVDVANARERTIHDLAGTSIVASLEPGQQHEMMVTTDVSPAPRRLRFTHLTE